ncbi:MAG: translation initiation factor IF-2 subunit gamma [Candidatus Aenigmarchaeota archaeon]|nr:translation initiation factor IF-2 subunit gamma [Candidatus Aenigmarchaeota archaeon]
MEGKRKSGKAKGGKDDHLPEVNIGLVGHVDHGKTTLTEALSGKWTDTHSEEMKRGITIKLGYADISFYLCKKCGHPHGFSTTPKCMKCFSDCEYLRTVSLVDAPGHETLMATVLAGAALMDGALLVISANEPCPQPQTSEHLVALNIAGIKNIVVVQNKIDRVTKEEAERNYGQIKGFLKGTVAEDAPVIPVSAQYRVNIDALIQAIQENIPTPKRDGGKVPKMLVARSFDVNKPGTPIEKLHGGVLGGSLVQGKLRVGDKIEICPGIMVKDKVSPLITEVTGLQKAKLDQQSVLPGGLLGVSTKLDPYLAKADALSGSVAGAPGKLPPVWSEISMKVEMLNRVVGTREEIKVEPLKPGVPLMLTSGTSRTVGAIIDMGKLTKIKLKMPICAEKGERVAISRQVAGRWRLVGWGEIS